MPPVVSSVARKFTGTESSAFTPYLSKLRALIAASCSAGASNSPEPVFLATMPRSVVNAVQVVPSTPGLRPLT